MASSCESLPSAEITSTLASTRYPGGGAATIVGE